MQSLLLLWPGLEHLPNPVTRADPTSHLATLADQTPPEPQPTTDSTRLDTPTSPTPSIAPPSPSPNKLTPAQSDDDEDDDPAAGYVQLDARGLGSGAQEVVEFLKEEDPEEQGEKGRELRRRRKFAECLGDDNVDLGKSPPPTAHPLSGPRLTALIGHILSGAPFNSRVAQARLGGDPSNTSADGMAAPARLPPRTRLSSGANAGPQAARVRRRGPTRLCPGQAGA